MKPFQNTDGMMVLKHLIFPGEGITDIADGLFENTEVVSNSAYMDWNEFVRNF